MTTAPDESTVDAMLREAADVWMGTPHLLGGTSTTGIDCSALVQNVFMDQFSVPLPRTTTQQSRIGRRVSLNELQAGDLIFYRIDADTRHVGIYMSGGEFMHASKSEGVTISLLDDPYWLERLWTIRRIIKSEPTFVDEDREASAPRNRVSW